MNKTYSKEQIHMEEVYQNDIAEILVNQQGYIERSSKNHYDKSCAIDTELLFNFIKETQKTEWEKFVKNYKQTSEKSFLKELEKNLKKEGTLNVLRDGIKIVPGFHFKLCYPKPASTINQKLIKLYNENNYSIIKELGYSKKNSNEIDIVMFLNGIPIITIECKNKLTGTTFKDAEKQYKNDRKPEGEPLLTFKRGALVHFATDEDNVSMTTKLGNGETDFLPFNRGKDNGAGNPEEYIGKFKTSYLYADQANELAVFSKEVINKIIMSFMYLDKNKKTKIETMIFPRFHQLDATLKLIEHAKINGSGQNYLIQHSAGSGKSNTIAWLAHQAITLHDEKNKNIFDSVVVVTDRKILDRQLQKTISQFEKTRGVVTRIDGTSKQLKEAIQNKDKIIITTIQKFSTEHLQAISSKKNKKFAIIIDEAHSSQAGKYSENMLQALLGENDDEDATQPTIEGLILQYQQNRGPQENVSYFAFTATPKTATIELFATKGNKNSEAFHLYSMKQAIEEGFILDVLKNYTTYQSYYELEKSIEDDPKFTTKKAKKKIARFVEMHPTNISQKIEVIIEHFIRHVAKEINGEGKAMIVAQSRLQAYEYLIGFKKYIKKKGYKNISALVAFSGQLKVDGEEINEASLNEMSESEVAKQFDTNNYQILIVAKKYQTGFDQPKLCGMYIDQKLTGLQTVQTLSRLNRTHPHKYNTYILDFKNTIDDVREAFKPYYESSYLEEHTDPNLIYELQNRIMTAGIVYEEDIENFATIYWKPRLSAKDRAMLQEIIEVSVRAFIEKDSEEEKEEFQQLLKSYNRFYAFISQMITLEDTKLEKLNVYVAWLSKLLPNRLIPNEIEITEDMLKLRAISIKQTESRDASLTAKDTKPVKAIERFGANPPTKEDRKELSRILDEFNRRHGTDFTEEEFIESIIATSDKVSNDPTMKEKMQKNPEDVVEEDFKEALWEEFLKSHEKRDQLVNILMQNKESREELANYLFGRAIKNIKKKG